MIDPRMHRSMYKKNNRKIYNIRLITNLMKDIEEFENQDECEIAEQKIQQ